MEGQKEQKLQEMQILEQGLQSILMQKQAFEMELAETSAALVEIGRSKENVYKMIGQLMIKKEKKEVEEELKNKEKMLKLRLENLGKQEADLSEKSDKLRGEVFSVKQE